MTKKTIDVPQDLCNWIAEKVKDSTYANFSHAVRKSVMDARDRDQALKRTRPTTRRTSRTRKRGAVVRIHPALL